MTETVTLDGTATTRWEEFEVIDSITKGTKTFEIVLENTDDGVTNLYESYDTAAIALNGTTIFNGRIDEIDILESEAAVLVSGKDYMGSLVGEYIIESYGIAQTMLNNESAGSSVVIEIADTTGFDVGDEVQVIDDNAAETAIITAVVTNTSITVATLVNSYTTAANARVVVGQLGSYIVNDLVQKYATALTRNGIQTSTNKFIVLFKGITAFDAIQQIADSEEYEFGHDVSLDFFYQPHGYEDSGLSIDLDSDDVLEYSFPKPGYDIVNRVDIYGATTGGVQVAIRVEDLASQEYYGVVRGQTTIDEKITTEETAYTTASAVLAEKAFVIQTGEISVFGYDSLKAGQLIRLLNFDGITDGTYLVTEVRRASPPGIVYISVAEYRTELEDVIVDLIRRMREREKESIDEDAVQTKFLNFYEDTHFIDEIVSITALNINQGYVIGHEANGLIGRGYHSIDGDLSTKSEDTFSLHNPGGYTLADTHTFDAVAGEKWQISDISFTGKNTGSMGGDVLYKMTAQAASLNGGVETTIDEGQVYLTSTLLVGADPTLYSASVRVGNYLSGVNESITVKFYFTGATMPCAIYNTTVYAGVGKQLALGRYFTETVII